MLKKLPLRRPLNNRYPILTKRKLLLRYPRNSNFDKGTIMDECKLYNFLKNNNNYPFHMPGHKRNPRYVELMSMGAALDITEICGADNLHGADGIILSAMERASRLWDSDKSYILVNGSTCGLLTAMWTVAHRGDKVLVSRNCHKSVYHGIELLGLRPVFLTPEYLEDIGVYGELKAETVKKAIDKHSDAVCVIAVSPTYEGYISDLSAISELCHRAGMVLIADEAHGAHLDLSPCFTGGAVRAWADITVHSLHKTLPALTQTAMLHLKGDRVDRGRLEHGLAIFQSSSPSYLLMSSAEQATAMAEHREDFEVWYSLIKGLYRDMLGLKGVYLLPESENRDSSKLVIKGKNGIALAAFLRDKGIELEYATESFALAMTGLGDRCEGFQKLAAALFAADNAVETAKKASFDYPYCEGELETDIETALRSSAELMPLSKAAGRVSAEYIWAYPPGIPLIIPGQPISKELAEIDTKGLLSDKGALPLVAVLK